MNNNSQMMMADGGGSGGSYDVKFSYEGVKALAGILTTNMDGITKANTKANSAASSAIAAVGGSGNEIGKAVHDAITSNTEEQLKQALEIVQNLVDAMTKVDTTYTKQKEDILAAIKKATVTAGSSGPGNVSIN